MLDQDDNVDVQALLGQFLYMLNLTEQQPKLRPRAARIEPPEYMLELYNHYSQDHSTRPVANIARSFKNEGTHYNVCFFSIYKLWLNILYLIDIENICLK